MNIKCECGQELSLEWKFCPKCGCDLEQNDNFSLRRAEELYLISKALLIGTSFCNADLDFVENVLPHEEEKSDSIDKDSIDEYIKLSQKAFAYCQKSAQLKNKEAQILLARFYIRGIGVDCNYKEAVEILKEYAEQGNAAAQVAIGSMYFRGHDSIKQDLQEAKKWFSLAAEQGNQIALSVLKEKFNVK